MLEDGNLVNEERHCMKRKVLAAQETHVKPLISHGHIFIVRRLIKRYCDRY